MGRLLRRSAAKETNDATLAAPRTAGSTLYKSSLFGHDPFGNEPIPSSLAHPSTATGPAAGTRAATAAAVAAIGATANPATNSLDAGEWRDEGLLLADMQDRAYLIARTHFSKLLTASLAVRVREAIAKHNETKGDRSHLRAHPVRDSSPTAVATGLRLPYLGRCNSWFRKNFTYPEGLSKIRLCPKRTKVRSDSPPTVTRRCVESGSRCSYTEQRNEVLIRVRRNRMFA